MQFKIPEQVFTLDESGYGRIRFELITEQTMDNEPETTPEADTIAPVETPTVEVSTSEDGGVQAPTPEVAKEDEVA